MRAEYKVRLGEAAAMGGLKAGQPSDEKTSLPLVLNKIRKEEAPSHFLN